MHRFTLPFTDAVLLLSSQWREMSPLALTGLALFCVILPAAIVMLYRYEMRLVKPHVAAMLLGLRLLVILFLLFVMVLQPIVAWPAKEEVQARVLLAIDRSNSMKIADPQRPAVDKLRLARALKITPSTEKQVDDWISQYEAKGAITWVGKDEFPDDAGRRLQLESERRSQHDQVCAAVDRLTRLGIVRRTCSGDGPDLLGVLARKHKVEVVGFSQELWDVRPEQFPELLDPYALARDPSAAEKPDAKELKDQARDDTTDLTLPLLRAIEQSGQADRKILGVILFTDGQHNGRTSKSPSEIASRMGPERTPAGQQARPASVPDAKKAQDKRKDIPIYPIAMGARKSPPDVVMASVQAEPKTVFKGMVVAVEASVKVSGVHKQSLVVELQRPGKDPMRETIVHDGSDRYYHVRFSLKMEQVGVNVLTVVAKPVEGEVRRDNNSQPVYVNVADDKAKVLVVDFKASQEFHYLWNALVRDPQMELKSIAFKQPRLGRITEEELDKLGNPRLQWPSDPDALAGYDCIVLSDLTPNELPLAERIRLEKYVSDRGGTLVILAGKEGMPMAFRNLSDKAIKPGDKEETDPILKLLPILEPRVVKPAVGFPLTFTHEGKVTKFLEMDATREASGRIWSELPRHYWGVIGTAKPGAQVLAYVAAPGTIKPAPGPDANPDDNEPGRNEALIVRQNYGFGRVLYVGFDSTWRWRYRTGDTYHHRFWSQVIHWAAADKPLVAGNDHVRFGTREPVYRKGAEIDLVARLADKEKILSPEALAGARVIKLPDDGKAENEVAAALVPLKRKPAQPRLLEGKIPPYLAPGKYAVELAIPELADKLDAALGPEGKPTKLRATFTVLPGASEESLELATNWPLLEDLAAKSGGKVLTPENVSEVVELLAKRTATIDRQPEKKVWEYWPTLVAFLILLTIEWVGRKMAGLP